MRAGATAESNARVQQVVKKLEKSLSACSSQRVRRAAGILLFSSCTLARSAHTSSRGRATKVSLFSDAQESPDSESLDAPLSRLLSLPEPFAIFEVEAWNKAEQWQEHTLFAPLGYGLMCTLNVSLLLLLLAVVPCRGDLRLRASTSRPLTRVASASRTVYRLWKVAGCVRTLSALCTVVGLVFPSTRRFSFSQLMEHFLGCGRRCSTPDWWI